MNRVMERSEENNVLGLAALNLNAVAMADAVLHTDFDEAPLRGTANRVDQPCIVDWRAVTTVSAAQISRSTALVMKVLR